MNKQICLRLIILIVISYMLSSCNSGQSHQASNTNDNLQNYKHALNDWFTSCKKSINVKNCNKVYDKLNQEEANIKTLAFSKLTLENIPPLFIFKHLEHIDLSNNTIKEIPTNAFAGLSSLNYINLSDNQIKIIPTNVFAGLSSLEYINLSGNKITAIPTNVFAGLSSLEFVGLSVNKITEVTTNVFNELSSLQRIDLTSNEITAISANAFAGLSALTLIELKNNQITTISTNAFVSLQKGATISMCITDTNLQNNLIDDYPDLVFQFGGCD